MLKPPNQRVVVTGYGLMTPFGFGEKPVMQHVFAGTDKFAPVKRFDTGGFKTSIAAISDFSERFLELGMELASEALHMAGIKELKAAAVLLGTTGDYGILNRFWQERHLGTGQRTDPSECMPAYHTAAIAENFGLAGRQWTFTNACIASSSAIASACDLIAQGRETTAICGGYSLVTEEIFAKFNSGRAFSKDGKVRSFSKARSGMLLGDGGAMLVLESLEQARRRGAAIYAEIAGWGIANDAFHVCQPDPSGGGMSRAIEKALARAGIQAGEVGYINAHGTGTALNDASETKAIKRIFGEASYKVAVTSTKTTTGHMLDGTGAVETVIAMIAMNAGVIPPTAGFDGRDPDCDLDYVPIESRRSDFRYALNLNAAFGGCNSAIVIKKIEDGGVT